MDRGRLKGYAANGDDHEKAWADWLKDDLVDVPGQPITSQASTASPTSLPLVRPPEPTPAPDVTIELKLPSLKLLKLPKLSKLKSAPLTAVTKTAVGASYNLLRKPSKKLALSSGAAVLLITTGVIGSHQLTAGHQHQQAVAAAAVVSKNIAQQKAAANTLSKPSFQPLVPKTEPTLATPETGVSAFDGSRDSYAFLDKFERGTIQVSEQPLPAQFKTGSEAAAKVATSLDATSTTTTNYGSAFIATQAKSNSQTVVFASDKLLIFIQSPFIYDSSKYQAYINNLQ